MKKNIIIILFFLLSSCQFEIRKSFNQEMIKELSAGNYNFPSKFGSITLYALSDKNEIIETNADYLNYVFHKHYLNYFKNYSSFLTKVLNEKMIISKSNFDNVPYKSFKIDSLIETKYKTESFKDFFNEYVKKKKNRLIMKVQNLNNNEVMSISYLLFINGYQVQIVDIRAEYYVESRDELFR
jgi:hypothetical protein